jgi:predicted RNA-binding Zn ribbon-like protein
MNIVSIGGHPALDFLNTAYAPEEDRVEVIPDGASLLAWLSAAGIVDSEAARQLSRRLGTKGLDTAAAEARKLREWTRDWLERWRSAPTRDYGAEIERLNKLLGKTSTRHELARTRTGLRIEARPVLASVDDILGLLAIHIAHLIADEDPQLVKSCAGAGCTLWFVDRTKAHRRIFCSATTCGNRAKVAAFRQRQRE